MSLLLLQVTFFTESMAVCEAFRVVLILYFVNVAALHGDTRTAKYQESPCFRLSKNRLKMSVALSPFSKFAAGFTYFKELHSFSK